MLHTTCRLLAAASLVTLAGCSAAPSAPPSPDPAPTKINAPVEPAGPQRGELGWQAESVADYEWLWAQVKGDGIDGVELFFAAGTENLHGIKDLEPALFRQFVAYKTLMQRIALAGEDLSPKEKLALWLDVFKDSAAAVALGPSSDEDSERQAQLTQMFCRSLGGISAVLFSNPALGDGATAEAVLSKDTLNVCDPYEYGMIGFFLASHYDDVDGYAWLEALQPHVRQDQDGDTSKRAVKAFLDGMTVDWSEDPQKAAKNFKLVMSLPVSEDDEDAARSHRLARVVTEEKMDVVEEIIARRECLATMKASESAWAVRARGMDELVELYNRYVKGRKESKAEYEGSGEHKYISAYRVSPQLYRLEAEIPQWRDQYGAYTSEVFRLLGQSLDALEKARELLLEGYYVKKIDYRGEFERAEAQRQIADEKLNAARHAWKNSSKHECVEILSQSF